MGGVDPSAKKTAIFADAGPLTETNIEIGGARGASLPFVKIYKMAVYFADTGTRHRLYSGPNGCDAGKYIKWVLRRAGPAEFGCCLLSLAEPDNPAQSDPIRPSPTQPDPARPTSECTGRTLIYLSASHPLGPENSLWRVPVSAK